MSGNLADLVYLKSLLKKEGIRPRRAVGQNFLVCQSVVESILSLVRDGPQHITELGAGVGTVTEPLLRAGYQVRAIEKDTKLADILKRNIGQDDKKNLDLIVGDLRSERWEWLDEKKGEEDNITSPHSSPSQGEEDNREYQLVGNIPYNLSGLVIRRVTQLKPVPDRVVLLVQREVGQRLTASPPNMHLLTLAVQLWGEAKFITDVPASCFWPQPKVDSQLVLLTPNKQEVASDDRERVLELTKPFWQTRRKQIGGVLRRKYRMNAKEVRRVLMEVGLDAKQRPQELTKDQWEVLIKQIV